MPPEDQQPETYFDPRIGGCGRWLILAAWIAFAIYVFNDWWKFLGKLD